MSHEELQSTMAQQGIQEQPVTAQDQQAMADAEAAEPPQEGKRSCEARPTKYAVGEMMGASQAR